MQNLLVQWYWSFCVLYSLDSPMLLDSSDDEESEADIPEPVKDIDSNSDTIIDVPEYAAEIHQYLKEAEVNIPYSNNIL